jgi:8-oxo-dGTP pyrophosphatase MutT (NUDIX family)
MLFTDGRRFLLVRRSKHVTEPGTWGVPGGAIPLDCTTRTYRDALESAMVETQEELGSVPEFRVIEIVKDEHEDGFVYTTFVAKVSPETVQSYAPVLDWETDDWRWVTPRQAMRLPLHPGLRRVSDRVFAMRTQGSLAKDDSIKAWFGTKKLPQRLVLPDPFVTYGIDPDRLNPALDEVVEKDPSWVWNWMRMEPEPDVQVAFFGIRTRGRVFELVFGIRPNVGWDVRSYAVNRVHDRLRARIRQTIRRVGRLVGYELWSVPISVEDATHLAGAHHALRPRT